MMNKLIFFILIPFLLFSQIKEEENEKFIRHTVELYDSFYTLKSKKIKHDISVQLYNKCKSFYKPVKIPTRVVYFDEVRKSKKKQKVGVIE